jgi:hypothetical protein
MNTRLYDLGFRERLRSQRLIRALVGLACFRVTLALQAGTGYHGILLAATTFQWILCTASLILLVLLNWAQRQRHPGIGSLSRELSYVGSGWVGVVLLGVVRPGAVVAAIREKTSVRPAAPTPAAIVRRRRRARLRSRRRRAELSSPGPAIVFSLAR